MTNPKFEDLLEAGCHFGHLRRKWNPAMAQYIFMEKNGIHIIDLYKTMDKLQEACAAAKQIAKSGRKILFVATKKQAKDTVAEIVKGVNMPYVTERWPGGMLTNFFTIRKAVKKMGDIDKLMASPQFANISKREKLQIQRERAKLEKNLGSIADLSRLPAAVFIVDVLKEHIAVAEARRLNINTFAIVDTNSNPNLIDFPIPANDDASKSIAIIVKAICDAIAEGLNERKMDKDNIDVEEEEEDVRRTEAADDEEEDAAQNDDKPVVKKVKGVEEEDGSDDDKPKRKRTTAKKNPVAKA
ncbi:MAG: 30S ribosomal protein S2 [Bacteroidales bacterium]|nr:30S ribosomal protein S2 [Bacteroidota bacterium]MBQ9508848.1 30S ribosomal protein S2 [Bacteroidales bacterium]MBR6064491.1 30S ribosomal protein S2 [Bacteroidales bacterium]